MTCLCFAICTSVGGRMSHTICMWHVHPLHMRMHFDMHVQIILQMCSWHTTSLCINICNAHAHTQTHTHTHTHTHNTHTHLHTSTCTIYMYTCTHLHILLVLWCGVTWQWSNISFVLAQWGTTALLRAAEGRSVPLVRALLEDYNSTLDEVNEVSCSSNVRCYLMTTSEVFLVACSLQLWVPLYICKPMCTHTTHKC